MMEQDQRVCLDFKQRRTDPITDPAPIPSQIPSQIPHRAHIVCYRSQPTTLMSNDKKIKWSIAFSGLAMQSGDHAIAFHLCLENSMELSQDGEPARISARCFKLVSLVGISYTLSWSSDRYMYPGQHAWTLSRHKHDGRMEMFYLLTHSTHFLYGYLA